MKENKWILEGYFIKDFRWDYHIKNMNIEKVFSKKLLD